MKKFSFLLVLMIVAGAAMPGMCSDFGSPNRTSSPFSQYTISPEFERQDYEQKKEENRKRDEQALRKINQVKQQQKRPAGDARMIQNPDGSVRIQRN